MDRPKTYLRFDPRPPSPTGKTKRWAVYSTLSNELLGWVQWHGPWRRYVFGTSQVSIFDAACLEEIEKFLTGEMILHKQQKELVR